MTDFQYTVDRFIYQFIFLVMGTLGLGTSGLGIPSMGALGLATPCLDTLGLHTLVSVL